MKMIDCANTYVYVYKYIYEYIRTHTHARAHIYILFHYDVIVKLIKLIILYIFNYIKNEYHVTVMIIL